MSNRIETRDDVSVARKNRHNRRRHTNYFEYLEDRTLLSSNPVGTAVITSTEISGFAYDKDVASTAISVRIDVNGTTVQTLTANGTNVGATAAIPAGHGFDITGSFTGVVDVYAIDQPSGNAVLIKSTNIKPAGKVAGLSTTVVSGYVFDLNNPSGAVHVKVLADGVLIGEGDASIIQPNIAKFTQGSGTAHGFSIPVTTPLGKHTIQVIATDPNSSSTPQVVLKTQVVQNKRPVGKIMSATNLKVVGYVTDPDAPGTALPVQIKVDGVLVTTVTANLGKPAGVKGKLGPGSAGAHWFVASLSGLTAGPHDVQMWVNDVSSGTPIKISDVMTPNQKPVGRLEVANQNTISGYAWDPDSTNPVDIVVTIVNPKDTSTYDMGVTSVARTIAGAPLTNVGFSFTTPTHLFGKNVVSVFAKDTFSGVKFLIGKLTFVNNAPKGAIEFASTTEIRGYAFDQDTATKSIDVLLYVDGAFATRVTASLPRQDLLTKKKIPSLNHGYDISMSGLAHGKHTLAIFAVDPTTGVTALIGSRVVTVV